MELEKPRITEIHVRMDCNGCVQKIKKALHGITGIYDLYIDFPQQKLTIVGWADPEKIVKAIKKTRKTAVICSHNEQPDPAAPEPEQPPNGGAPSPSDGVNPPPQEAPPTESPPPENTAPPPAPENPNPQPEAVENQETQPPQEGCQPQLFPTGLKDVGGVHMVYHQPPPPDYGYRYGYGRNYNNAQYYGYPRGHAFMHELQPSPPQPQMQPQPMFQPQPQIQPQMQPQLQPQKQPQPVYVTHSYNTYKPSPYVTEYEYARSPPQYRNYGSSRADHYSEDYSYHQSSGSNGNINSIFSDENPNACRIM